MDNSIEEMMQDLARARYAAGTVAGYTKAMSQFVEHVGKPVESVSREELRRYVDTVLATASVSRQRTDLAALLFLYRQTLGRAEMVSFVRLPKKRSVLAEVLSVEEVSGLLNSIVNPRIQAMATVMYGAGLRVAEVRGLTVSDIDGPRGVIRVQHGKGNRAREAKLSESLYHWLRNYWYEERPPLPYLFASAQGRLPLFATIRAALAKAATQVSIAKRVTPHVLRHSFATHLLEQGSDVHVVSALLGHASLKSTQRYARVTNKIVRQTPSPFDLLPMALHR